MFYTVRQSIINLTIIVVYLFYKEELKRLHSNWLKISLKIVLIRWGFLLKILSNRFLFFSLNILSLLSNIKIT